MILTCEHGGNEIPKRFSNAFKGAKQALRTHRGYDLGALLLARKLSERLEAPLFFATISRLLVDLNRSLDHTNVFSEFSKTLEAQEKSEIIELHYFPHRNAVTRVLEKGSATHKQNRPSVHVAIHSFTPILNGKQRHCEIGILFDHRKARERAFAISFRHHLEVLVPEARVRFNYPYKGDSDGFPTDLRKKFKARYVGIELEFRQDYLGKMQNRRTLDTFADHIALALESAEADLLS